MFAGFMVLLSGTAIAQALALVVSPLLTRMYSPDDFGILGGVLAVSSVLATFIHGRLNLAIAKQASIVHKQEVLLAGGGLVLAMTIAFAVIVYLVGQLGIFIFSDLIYVALVLSSFIAVIDLLNYYNGSVSRHQYSASSAVVRSVVVAVLQVGFGLYYATRQGEFLVYAVLAGAIGAVVLNWVLLVKGGWLNGLRNTEVQSIATRLAENSGYIYYSAPQGALAAISLNAVPLLFALFFSPAIVGYYWLAYRVLLAPIGFLGGAYRQSIYPYFSDANVSILSKLDKVSRHSAVLSTMSLIASAGLLMWGEQIFSFVFGAGWRQAGVYAGWLAICFGLDLAKIPAVSFVHALQLHKMLLLYEAALAVARVSVIFIFSLYSDMAAVIGFALVSAAFSGGLMLYVNVYCRSGYKSF